MRNLVTKVKNRVTGVATDVSLAVAGIKSKEFPSIKSRKLPGGKEIIIELLLAAIAIALAFIFRTQITDVIKNLTDGFKTTINGIFGSGSTSTP